jgi:hypothetical protein
MAMKNSPESESLVPSNAEIQPPERHEVTALSTGQALLDFLTISPGQEAEGVDPIELDIHDTIIVPSLMPEKPPEVFHYRDFTEKQRQWALKRGYFPVSSLSRDMEKLPTWDEAFPQLWELLLCWRIPDQPRHLKQVHDRNRFAVLTKVFRAAMGDLGIDYRHDRHPVLPPRLVCYGVVQSDYTQIDPPAGNGYWDCYIKTDEFKVWVADLSELIDMQMPLPKTLLEGKVGKKQQINETELLYDDTHGDIEPQLTKTKKMWEEVIRVGKQLKANNDDITLYQIAESDEVNTILVDHDKKELPTIETIVRRLSGEIGTKKGRRRKIL